MPLPMAPPFDGGDHGYEEEGQEELIKAKESHD